MSPFQMRYQRSWRSIKKPTGSKRWPILLACLALLMTGFQPLANASPVKPQEATAIEPSAIDLDSEELRYRQAFISFGGEALQEVVDKYSRMYDVPLLTFYRVAYCESHFDPHASNQNSSAKGIMQFTDTTWEYINASGHQFDAEESIKQFFIWYPIHPDWWECK